MDGSAFVYLGLDLCFGVERAIERLVSLSGMWDLSCCLYESCRVLVLLWIEIDGIIRLQYHQITSYLS